MWEEEGVCLAVWEEEGVCLAVWQEEGVCLAVHLLARVRHVLIIDTSGYPQTVSFRTNDTVFFPRILFSE